MSIAVFVQELAQRGVELFIDDGRLRYRAVVGALTDDLRAEIFAQRAALIAHLQDDPGSTGSYPLSHGQAALWFLYEIDRDSLAYNIALAARLIRDLDLGALRAALAALHARHPVLCSRFAAQAGAPSQDIGGPQPSFDVVDASGWSHDEVDRSVAAFADQLFDLENGPVARWRMLTGTANGAAPTPLLVFAVHHAIVDFRSLEIVFKDLGRLYHAQVADRSAELPALPWTYRDYVRWSRSWPQSPPGQAARAYWLAQLDAAPPALDLPSDRPRPARQQYDGAQLLSGVPAELAAALRDFARRHRATPNMVLLSTFGLMLHRYSGCDDFLVGTPTLGRSREELRDLVGYFVNTVAVRLRFPAGLDGRGLVAQTRQTLLDVLAHQDYPFPLLVEELRPERDPSRPPLVQVMFVYERESGDDLESQGLVRELLPGGQRGAAFDLTLTALDRGDTIRLAWDFATGLFEPDTIRRMAGHFGELLRALLTSPDASIGTLPIMGAAEQAALRIWNETEAPWPANRTLADLFAEQVERTPDAIALEADGRALTYRALDEAACALASRLQNMGARPNGPIAIALPRSVEQIIAVLGVIRSGGACLPLDVDHPADRLAYMIEECAPTLIVTTPAVASALPKIGAAKIFVSATEEPPDMPLAACPARPGDLLYVLYTSGSTGRPKGVAVVHRTLVNLVSWQGRQPGLDRPARVLQFSPLTFDVAFQEIATTLCAGGALVLIDEHTRRDSRSLLATLAASRVERLFLPFVALQQLAESAASGGAPASLQEVITAGEQLRITPAIRSFFRRHRCRLHNHYGPTETHVVTALRLPVEVEAWDELPPIGVPIANVQVHVLDEAGSSMPVGVPGEICIGGVALAREYLNQPALTMQRFFDHPTLGRLYRTGDFSKWRRDGVLVYLGRRDRQIKLRGFRIELGEIEAVLGRHAGVSEAAVIVDGDGDTRRLLAYVAAPSADSDDLRRSLDAHLRAHLPTHMVPVSVSVLPRLPQTSSGKFDRRALAPPPVSADGGFVEPRSATELLLAGLCAAILQVPLVSATANFFALGGHSLAAMRLCARIREAFDVELPLRVIFERPTIAQLAEFIDSRPGIAALPAPAPRPHGSEVELSFGQQRLWFLGQLEGPSATYNMPATLALHGRLDAAALCRAFTRLVERHASLRQCFPSQAGQPCSRLLDPYDPLTTIDLSGLPPAERNAGTQRLSRDHAAQPFDLANGPLFRVGLLRLADEEHWLLFNMHHIISDGWSIDLIIRELRLLYGAYRAGLDPELTPLAIQYTDYAIWQRSWLRSDTLERQLDYWRETLAGAPEKLELPTDFPRPAVQRHSGGVAFLNLSGELVQGLTSLAQSAGGTLFIGLVAAFATLLSRASGQRDLCIGVPVANRNNRQLENIVGLFLNTLILRVQTAPDASFRELLQEVRRTALTAYAHQDVPFEYLVEKLRPQRSLSHNPLFQVMLNLVNTQTEEVALDGLDVNVIERVEGHFAKFDVSFSLIPRPDGGLDGRLDYNAELFAAETIAFLAERFVTLVRQVIAHPDRPLADITLLDEIWRAGTTAMTRLCPATPAVSFGGIEASLAGRFAEQVLRHGHRIAVGTAEGSITYQALDEAARRVAGAILVRASGRHVALLLPHDGAMAVGVVATLQAGRAYVPLDPLQPIERLAHIVEDAEASAIVCTAGLRDIAAAISGGTLPVIEIDDPAVAPASDLPSVAPDQSAYLIYTSGSTGRPKAVIQSQRNVLHFIRQYTEALRIGHDDRLLQVASYAFDAGVMDMFGALLNGASLHPVDIRRIDPEACCARIAAEGITVLHATPTVFRLLARHLCHPLPSVRLVVLGGEGVTRADALLFRERFAPGCLLVNGFGPTESTVTLQNFIDHAVPLPRANLPVGYPVGDTDILLLDADGATAELYGEITVRSAHVALGYWRQPSAAFSDDPELPGKRRYRTGDLGRLLPDGSLEVVGRVDRQIKLRGFRIEQDEIEAALREHPGVREAAVMLWPAADDPRAGAIERRLVAYAGGEARSADLRNYLRQKLPDYMVPASVTVLAELPLTANGKLDRSRLPEPVEDNGAAVAAATPTEELVASIWSAVLGRESVGRGDNFFDLGGHSLLAMQLVARLRENLGVELPLRVLFEHPVLHDLAAAVDASQRTPLPPLQPLAPLGASAELPLSFAQQRLWFLSQLRGPGDASYNVTAALRLDGALDEAALRQALWQLTARQASLRMNIRERGGEPLVVVGEPYDPLAAVIDLGDVAAPEREAAIARHAEAHGSRPFDLARDRLLRLSLLRLGEQEFVLLFAIHHIVADGWSLGVVVRELGALYAAASAGGDAGLPALEVQYTDYSAWQRGWLQGEVLAQELAHWRAELSGAPALLNLPADFARPAVKSYRGAQHGQQLAAELTAGLKRLSRSQGATLYMTLLAAFDVLLQRYSGESDVVVGTPIAGRTQRVTEPLVGFFVNTLALRVQLSGDQPFTDVLAEVRRKALSAYAHQELPFEMLVNELQPQRSLSSTPLFQVMFALQNAPVGEVRLGEVEARPLWRDPGTAKFDLTLSLIEQGDGLAAVWEYSTDLFTSATIERMSRHYGRLLEEIIADPSRAIASLPLLDGAEQAALAEFNATGRDYPRERGIAAVFGERAAAHPQARALTWWDGELANRTLADLFAEQVERTPNAIAVEADGRALTYRALDEAACALASRLQNMGARPNGPIAIALPRSVEQIIAVLGVIRSGGACLPLDVDHPADRLAYMIEECAPTLIVTTPAVASALPKIGAAKIFVSATEEPPDMPLAACPARPGDLLYVLYTSGSTGRPKGVAVVHRTLVNLVSWQGRQPGLDRPARVLQFSPLTFDVAFQEIATTLCAGGALVLIDEHTRRDARCLLATLAACQVERLFLPFVALQHLAESAASGGAPASLQEVITAGEQLRITPAIRSFFRRHRCRLHNHYGPTETHVVTALRLPVEVEAWDELPPIGVPIANVQVHVLDEAGSSMPVGVPGEICIGGVALAREYLNQPALTMQRFFDHPTLGRLYRTGDFGKWRRDGVLVYLGRRDRQIKLRGFRIELGEIEAVLGRHAGVSEAAVIVLGEGEHRRLVAYVTGPALPDVELLRQRLRRALPEPMVPGRIVPLSELPLTANGKLDRSRLPEPVEDNGAAVAAATPTEELVASIWSAVLGRESVGRGDNFFDLGGHSLLAMQLVARLRENLGVELPLRVLFEHPVLHDLAAAVDASQRTPLPPLQPLAPLGASAELPLSFAQQRLWFLSQLRGPGDASYNVTAALRLDGALDEAALRQALWQLTARQASLRMNIRERGGEPLVVVGEPYDPLAAVIDLGDVAAPEREAAIARHAEAHGSRPFDLARDRLLRLSLLRLGEQEFVLLFAIHHIVADGWSLGVVVRELGALYAAASAGGDAGLPALEVQYTDYSAWQRGWLQGEVLAQELAHWRAELSGAPALLNLPADFARPAVKSYRGAQHGQQLAAELTAGLKRLSRSQGATLYMTLLAAFDVLLQRYSGESDVVVGTPIAGRTQRVTEPLVGFFVNTLALRVQLSGDQPFTDVLAEVRRKALSAYAHQELPFEVLVNELQPQRSLSSTPLFQVMFALQNAPVGEVRLGEVEARPLWRDPGTAKFDLTLSLIEQGDGLAAVWEYSTDLFTSATIERMSRHYGRLLEGIIADPSMAIAELPLLDGAEQAALAKFNATGRDYRGDRGIAAVFGERVAAQPQARALSWWDGELDYAGLEAQANRLAHHLRAKIEALPGVSAAQPVIAVYLERSPELVVALLGVLKAGAAYLPLDAQEPAERLGFMLSDAGAVLVVSTRELSDHLPAGHPALVLLDEEAAAIAARPESAPPCAADGKSLAYVMYTSGSTGQPKGVCIAQRAVLRLAFADYVQVGPGDCIAQAANAAFDALTFEIWGALLNGAAVHVLRREEVLDPARFADQLRAGRFNTLFLTTALFNRFAALDPSLFAALDVLLFGGEAVDPGSVAAVLAHGRPRLLLHVYGPTESTTFATSYEVETIEPGAATVPIGRPLSNTTAHVLDPLGAPVPIGVAGELHIGGDGLATVYLNRPELTAERFIVHPQFGRLYRTGDLCRRLADGNLVFLGRLDQQIKLRGFRIEPGEIEAHLRREAGVKDAAVIVLGEGEHRRLVAYVTGPALPDVELLRQRLRRALPEPMVPGRIVPLSELPLTANGKLDRSRLPEPVEDNGAAVAAATPTEELVASIWSAVLGRESVGRGDNFFDLGGHSLLAMQLVASIRSRLSVELPLEAIFANPTLRDLAAAIDADCSSVAAPIERVDRKAPLPLSFAQERLWFLAQLEAENPFYNTPFALRLTGLLRKPALQAAFAALVARHEVLRTAFVNDDGRPRQVVLPELPIPLTGIDLTHLASAEREAAVLAHAQAEALRPFEDLGRPPLLRTILIRLAPDDHVLLLTMHHIVMDGWSLNVVLREIAHVYNGYGRADVAILPPLSIQYADFAAWQRNWLSSGLDRQLAYWRQQLAGAPPILALPTDHPRPALQQFRGGSVRFAVDRATTSALRRLARAHDATMFMTLLAAFGTLMFRYSGQHDLVVGSPIANRQRSELEPLVGFFVNTLALRIDLTGAPSFADLLDRVRRTALDAYANQDLPFEKLVDELQPERDLSRSPLFQVMLALQNMPLQETALTELKLSPIRTERRAALFDLVLDLWETPDGLTGVLEYNRDLFEAETALQLTDHLRLLLRRLAAEPYMRINEVSLLDATEIHRLLAFSNGPSHAHATDQSLITVFERQAAATPSRTAAIANGQALTYATLNARANRLAHLLRGLDVGPGMPVGVLVPRGLDYLPALIGIAKAGGVFLPLDPAYPTDRLRYMIEDGALAIVLTTPDLADELASRPPAALRHLVLVGDSPEQAVTASDLRVHAAGELARHPDHNPPMANSGRDLLYMLYTSGTTGVPKGAMVRHDGALNHIFAEFRLLCCDQDMAFLQSAPASSDISVWQCLAPLLIGGRVVFADHETVCTPPALFELIRRDRVTLIELVPVVLQGLIDYAAQLGPGERELPCLRWAMVTGEAVSVSLVNRYFEVLPSVPLVNAYGPTEAADDVCQHVLRGPLPQTQSAVPIGGPIDNMSILVVDDRTTLVPIGVPGEICVSGIGVGAGYWRQPERTATAFVANPYAEETFGDVLYRTGDVGRWRLDGVLEFLGRSDDQVKIRGFRVELGEVEAALARHAQIRDVIVVNRDDGTGQPQLAAYLQVRMDSAQSDPLLQEQIALWKDLHERSYGEVEPNSIDPAFNITGWDSTYTGASLTTAEMEECVESAVGRIIGLGPRNLLEIGCGTGLLLYRLVSHCARYWGTDFSSAAIHQLERDRDRVNRVGLDRADLRVRTADDFSDLARHEIDTIVLNSVVQYFPNLDYLLRVLRGAADNCVDGGAIFVGDVRNLQQLRSYHASVQYFRAADSVTCGALRERVAAQLAREQELALAPGLFHLLAAELPRIGAIELRPKRGLIHNEMTRFRYDALLWLGTVPPEPVAPADAWCDWRQDQPSIDGLIAHLHDARPAYWGLRHVANARLATERQVLGWLDEAPPSATVGDLRASLREGAIPSLDPEALWHLAETLPYHVDIQIEPNSVSGEFAVLFCRRDVAGARIDPGQLLGEGPPVALADCVNNPLQEAFARRLLPTLREFLKTILPGHMIPSSFTVLERFPLLPNGKVDRSGLPAPVVMASDGASPRNATEKTVQGVWAAVLGVAEPGIHDNFFALGGHSLKATQVVSRLQQRFGKAVALREIFSHPTITELAGLIDREQESTAGDFIAVTPEAQHYPVSRAQQRLWVLSQMGGAEAYHMSDALRLRGALDVKALQGALAAVVDRHEILRTRFIEVGSELRQAVAQVMPTPFDVTDLSQHEDLAASLRREAMRHAQQPFDLGAGPLLRVRLLRLGSEDHVLLFAAHHIIADGWSLDVLSSELMALYGAACQGRRTELSPLAVQYRDYVSWQDDRLTRRLETLRTYWLAKLAQLPPLDLPTDFPRPPVKTYRGSAVRSAIASGLRDRLVQLAQARGVSLFMVLTALVKVMLHRFSGAQDIAVGFPVAGRERPELEGQIGFYVNTLILRDNVAGDEPFLELLARLRATATEAYEHQDYPFDQLVQDLNPSRDASRNPLFDVMVVLQNTANVALDLPGLTIEPVNLDYGSAQFDLLWNFAEGKDGLQLVLRYNSDLFRRETVESLLGCWPTLVAAVVADPNRTVGQLPLLTPQQRADLIPAALPSPELAPSQPSLVHWFETVAGQSSDAIAVTDGDRQFSYGELNRRANVLGRQLRARLDATGADIGGMIGLCVARSVDMIIGMLGILKAGAAYVPIDPDTPGQRIRFILEDARVSILLTQDGVLDIPPEDLPPRHLMPEAASFADAEQSDLCLPLAPDAPAYVIYTSGSTGEPKGAIVSHGNVMRLFSATRPWFGFGAADVWTLFHSCAFDFSVWEIFGALLHGGRLVLVPYQVSRSPDEFYRLLSLERVTVLNQTPSAFRQLMPVDAAAPRRLSLRLVIFGGEALDPATLRPWFERHGDLLPQLVNMYGITETTVHVTYRPLSAIDAEQSSSPIGIAIPDLRLLILDEQCEPVPAGIPGELYVGGAGVAQGYLRREALTLERFIVDPFRPVERLYRTGDRVRRRADGELEYLGRLDSQVKIRGHRIETGEIVATLRRHRSIRDAAVTVHEREGDARLVAYCVPEPGLEPEVDALRSHLRQFLPTYMMPAQFVTLQALPLTANGKLDPRAFPNPEAVVLAPRPSGRKASSPLEREVLECWRAVLGNDLLQLDDNVFDHGAHSVLAVQVRNMLQERLHRNIPMVLLFQFPSVAGLAAELARGVAAEPTRAAPSRRAVDRREAVRRRGAKFGGEP